MLIHSLNNRKVPIKIMFIDVYYHDFCISRPVYDVPDINYETFG